MRNALLEVYTILTIIGVVDSVDVDARVSSHFKEELAWAVGNKLRVISKFQGHRSLFCVVRPLERI